MDSTSEADADLRARVRQQEALADLGRRALETDDIDELLRDAATAIAETLETEFASVLEGGPDDDEARLRAGVGWPDGLVGSATVPVTGSSQAGATLREEEPVIVEDLRTADRSSGPELLTERDVGGGIGVVVGSTDDPWGVLTAHALEERAFADRDAEFVQDVADVLAAAIEETRTKRRLRERERELEETFERITDAFIGLDRSWEITYINDRGAELLDPEGRGLVGENFWDPFEPALGTTFEEEYRKTMGSQEPTSFEAYYPPLETWFEVHAYPSESGLSIYFRDATERKERERELELFRTLLDHSNDSVLVIDPETGQYLDVNATACRRRGYSREELLELTVPDVEMDMDDLDEWRTFVTELKEEGRASFDGEHRRKDGSTFPVEINATYVELERATDDERERAYVLATARDVTERRRRERELEESERRYRTLAECFPNGIVTLFDDDLEYTLAAGQAFADLPVDPDDLERRNVRAAWDEETADALEPKMRSVLEGEEESIELKYAGREWMVQMVPVTDEGDTVFAGMSMAQDVTERKEIQRKLEESERRYRTLAENFPNGAVAVYDEALRYTLVQGAMVDGPLPDRDHLEGKTIAEVFPDDIVADLDPLLRTAVEDGETDSGRFEFADRHLRVWATPLRDADGEIFAGLSFTQDITEQVEREAALEESNERLEQFAYAASHDLQEPLRMVSSYLSLIEHRYGDELDDDGQEFLEFAVDAAERMREMIDGLLAYSRVDTQGDPLEPVDLDRVLESARENLQVKIEESGAEIAAEPLPRVLGDESQLQQVFQNLLSNAIEYAGDEPPRVDVSAERTGETWRIAVRDEGIGIDAEDADRIFEVFQRLHSHEDHAGTGIGLALCRRIVERHGGEISVDSEPGESTTFSFTLPAADEREE